jgi:hypothetical protein
MNLTTENMAEAKNTVGNLLEQLGLTAYLFEVEPRTDHWEVRVECALDSGWQSSVLNVDDKALRACRTDHFVRDQLLGEWRRRLTVRGSG